MANAVKKAQYGPEDFKVGDEWCKDDREWFQVTDVKEFWDSGDATYIAVGGWYTTEDYGGGSGTYEDAYWRLEKFNEWVQGAVKVQEGTRPATPHYIQNKNASTKKSKSVPNFSDMVNKQRSKNNSVAKEDSTIRAIYDDISEIRQKLKDINSEIFE